MPRNLEFLFFYNFTSTIKNSQQTGAAVKSMVETENKELSIGSNVQINYEAIRGEALKWEALPVLKMKSLCTG